MPALILSLLYIVILIGFIVIWIFTVIKRFHDINEPGTHFLFLLIPLYNIFIGLKLLSKPSSEGISDYDGKVRNTWYWQVPLTVLLVPILYIAVGYGLSAQGGALNANAADRTYSSTQYGISIMFPAGWTRIEKEGYIVAEQSRNGSVIALEVSELDNTLMFDRYTNETFSLFIDSLDTKEKFGTQFHMDAGYISDYSIIKKDINGKAFVQIEFLQRIDSSYVRHFLLFGIYNDRAYNVEMVLIDNAVGNDFDAMMESAGSIRIEALPRVTGN